MDPGDAVEVSQVWASGGAQHPPYSTWVKGYEFVRAEDGGTVIVRALRGMWKGCEVRYDADAVRLAGGAS